VELSFVDQVDLSEIAGPSPSAAAATGGAGSSGRRRRLFAASNGIPRKPNIMVIIDKFT
jgi:hypothetical protein